MGSSIEEAESGEEGGESSITRGGVTPGDR